MIDVKEAAAGTDNESSLTAEKMGAGSLGADTGKWQM
jgi:hypothetical protein